jgi:hypothetical protein
VPPQNIGRVSSSRKGKAPGRVGGEKLNLSKGLLQLILVRETAIKISPEITYFYYMNRSKASKAELRVLDSHPMCQCQKTQKKRSFSGQSSQYPFPIFTNCGAL